VSGHLEQAIRQTIQKLAPTVSRRMEDEAEEIRHEAEGRWPVGRERGRPHSRDLFEHGLRIDGSTLVAWVRNPADYLFYIKTYKNGLGGKSAFQELLRKPLKAAAGDVARDCADEIAALIRRG
jgi:hypothetical protein